ncbi:LOW QUALITY PROTEIN: guanylyl cyclase-activating protein 3, partial [Dugong dugon]
TLHEFTLLGLCLNQKAGHHVDHVYNIFDMNKDGFIDFLEFIAAINLVVRRRVEQKLKWYFKLCDADGNGSIDKKELRNEHLHAPLRKWSETMISKMGEKEEMCEMREKRKKLFLFFHHPPTTPATPLLLGIDFRNICQWHGKRSSSGDCFQELQPFQHT